MGIPGVNLVVNPNPCLEKPALRDGCILWPPNPPDVFFLFCSKRRLKSQYLAPITQQQNNKNIQNVPDTCQNFTPIASGLNYLIVGNVRFDIYSNYCNHRRRCIFFYCGHDKFSCCSHRNCALTNEADTHLSFFFSYTLSKSTSTMLEVLNRFITFNKMEEVL